MKKLYFNNTVGLKDIITSERDAVEIKMTWGGGMGGSQKSFYGIILESNDREFVFHDLIEDETIKLSYNFKVYERPIKLVISSIIGKECYFYALKRNEEYEVTGEYKSNLSDTKEFITRVNL